jgi:hypothetical protein
MADLHNPGAEKQLHGDSEGVETAAKVRNGAGNDDVVGQGRRGGMRMRQLSRLRITGVSK